MLYDVTVHRKGLSVNKKIVAVPIFNDPMMEKPAILGGTPLFDDPLPVMRPTLPDFHELEMDIREILETGLITNYKFVEEFEGKCAQYIGVRNAVALSNCTSGLILIEKCLGLKGEVLVPSFTFSATVHSLLWNNLEPVFVDCNLDTYNIDPTLVEEAITPTTSAILAVYIFGNPPDIEGLEKIAKKNGLKIIMDAAQGFGATYKGKPAGNFGHGEVFSLSPTKLLVAGEGGIVATNDDELAEKIKIGRDYGNPGNYDCQFIGLNARMGEFNAILGIKSLQRLEENLHKRLRLVEIYKKSLEEIPGIYFQKLNSPDCRSTYKDFSVFIDAPVFGLTRDQLGKVLEAENISTKNYYSPPIHSQRAYGYYYEKYRNKLPNTDKLAESIICLPLYSHMPEATVEKVSWAIRRAHYFHRDIKKYS